MIWDYLGYEIDEGIKPHDENFNDNYYQYFFIVKRDDEKKFKFCIWAKIDALESDPGMVEEAGKTGHKIPESIYRTAHARVMEKIEQEDAILRLMLVPRTPRSSDLDDGYRKLVKQGSPFVQPDTPRMEMQH